jgi:hypothetical protein
MVWAEGGGPPTGPRIQKRAAACGLCEDSAYPRRAGTKQATPAGSVARQAEEFLSRPRVIAHQASQR